MKDDMISRQAAIDAIRASTSKYTGFMEMEMYTDDDAVEAVEKVEAVDAVSVVRCKDCKYWDTVSGSTFAPMHHQCKVIKLMSIGTWYCASGERKDEKDEA